MKKNNSIKINSNKKEYQWDVCCADGTHHVRAKKITSGDRKVEVYLDNRRVETIAYHNTLFKPTTEYSFACGDERLILVIYREQMDIVYGDHLVGHNMPYRPKSTPPLFYQIGVAVLSLLAIALMYITGAQFESSTMYFLAVLMPFCCAVLSYSMTTSPFLTKQKKYLFSSLFVAWAWALEFILIFVFYGIQVWL